MGVAYGPQLPAGTWWAVHAVDESGLVAMRVLERTASGARILVRDRGPGIQEAVRDDLLAGREPSRASRASGEEDSHGLGLSIVRRLVALHGGRLDVRAERDAGTVFVAELPPGA